MEDIDINFVPETFLVVEVLRATLGWSLQCNMLAVHTSYAVRKVPDVVVAKTDISHDYLLTTQKHEVSMMYVIIVATKINN